MKTMADILRQLGKLGPYGPAETDPPEPPVRRPKAKPKPKPVLEEIEF